MDIELLKDEYTHIIQEFMDLAEDTDDIEDISHRRVRLPTFDDHLFVFAQAGIRRLFNSRLSNPSDLQPEHAMLCLNMYLHNAEADGIEVSSNDGMAAIKAIHNRLYGHELVGYTMLATRILDTLARELINNAQVGSEIKYRFYLDYSRVYGGDFNLLNMGNLQDGLGLLFAKGQEYGGHTVDQYIMIGGGPYTPEYAKSVSDQLMASKSMFL